MNEITVILNCYKRPQYLKEQIESIENQSIKPKEIWIWYNNPEDREQLNLNEEFGNYKIIHSNHNFKFHARFALGLLARTEYIAFFDDDTIPGNQWFESCIKTMDLVGDSILGSTGVLLDGESYLPHRKIGWNGMQNLHTVRTDLVGHSWFMRKSTLKYLFYEEPVSWDNGEDIQLSYLALKYGNIKTYVPPHPPNDLSIWGSNLTKGNQYGNDSASSWKNSNHLNLRNEIASKYIRDGWQIVRKTQ